jgi:hypothetical protein
MRSRKVRQSSITSLIGWRKAAQVIHPAHTHGRRHLPLPAMGEHRVIVPQRTLVAQVVIKRCTKAPSIP